MFTEPKISLFNERPYVGIRVKTPFKGMFAVVDKLLKELRAWVKTHEIADEGPFFLRYHVIDMAGMMDIEVGFMVGKPIGVDARVQPGLLPAGRYAHLTYSRYALRGNKALLGWIQENNVNVDRWDDEEGDAFACRYEAYLTDYRVEPRKSAWEVELAIKVADDA
ncbi:MAG: GyrI-like domain-containing protein [Anaerolineae bacterium]|nr:GyrI-like domain-containing protein [Anaerolineae bacterium]